MLNLKISYPKIILHACIIEARKNDYSSPNFF